MNCRNPRGVTLLLAHDRLVIRLMPLRWQDALTSLSVAVPSPSPDHLSCTFETPDLCGWTQDHLDDHDWKWTMAYLETFTGSLGAKTDHTLGTPSGTFSEGTHLSPLKRGGRIGVPKMITDN